MEIKGAKLHKTPLTQFIIEEGRISGFDVHPSKDYVVITSNAGRVYVFRIDTGELRGSIVVPLHAKGCVIDPSGLYVVVSVPPFSNKCIKSPGQDDEYDPIRSLGTHENDIERTTLLMFEIGTGQTAAEIKSAFEVSVMQFSEDGKYLALGSERGSVSVWAVGLHLYKNIKQVLDSMRIQPDFWYNYPIYLPDYQMEYKLPSFV